MSKIVGRVVVMRGIPGSGKSTTAKWLASLMNGGEGSFVIKDCVSCFQDASGKIHAAIHSTDEYFMTDGVYKYNPANIGKFHTRNFQAFKDSLEGGIPLVIVDNTNTTRKEYQKYITVAEAAGYLVSLMVLPHPSLGIAAKRNTHNVPSDVIKKMLDRWEA